jgi:hypothetical protein
MDFIRSAALDSARHAEVDAMRDFLFPRLQTGRPKRPARHRQVRERRTAQALTVFGLVLAAVELYVIFGGF